VNAIKRMREDHIYGYEKNIYEKKDNDADRTTYAETGR
jgi:hypothetical protein